MSVIRRCTKCGVSKALADFHIESRSKSGFQRWCKACANKYRRDRHNNNPAYRAKRHESQKRLYRKNPVAWILRCRKNEMLRKYGLTWIAYQWMLAQQENKCALCRTDAPGGKGQWHVDHCHDSKIVRGILCHSCNTGLGTYEKFKFKLGEQRIAAYLRGDK